uniref:C-type lectin domain-containing protein n=1 Tax=Mola mola TaxID=94237 RepID=A0A3Q3WFD8_MOLML
MQPGTEFTYGGQRICRRGTERPCYKVSYIQDSGRRLTFEDARQACRSEGGELLSIETESEQRLIERFIRQLPAGDGDFWIGLRRSPQRYMAELPSPGCPSQYYWLDGSKAKFRNWQWDEPSCGGEMCAVLYYQPSAPPDDEGQFLFRWNDDNCNSKNNFVCKYPESESGNHTLYVSYILYATIPALLLLVFAAVGFFCYKQHGKRYTQKKYKLSYLKPRACAKSKKYLVLFLFEKEVSISVYKTYVGECCHNSTLLFMSSHTQEEDTNTKRCQQIKTLDGDDSFTLCRSRTLRL